MDGDIAPLRKVLRHDRAEGARRPKKQKEKLFGLSEFQSVARVSPF